MAFWSVKEMYSKASKFSYFSLTIIVKFINSEKITKFVKSPPYFLLVLHT